MSSSSPIQAQLDPCKRLTYEVRLLCHDIPQEGCLICQDAYNVANGCRAVRIMECGHVIGLDCFMEWTTRISETCPYWNHKLTPIVHEEKVDTFRSVLLWICRTFWFRYMEEVLLASRPWQLMLLGWSLRPDSACKLVFVLLVMYFNRTGLPRSLNDYVFSAIASVLGFAWWYWHSAFCAMVATPTLVVSANLGLFALVYMLVSMRSWWGGSKGNEARYSRVCVVIENGCCPQIQNRSGASKACDAQRAANAGSG